MSRYLQCGTRFTASMPRCHRCGVRTGAGSRGATTLEVLTWLLVLSFVLFFAASATCLANLHSGGAGVYFLATLALLMGIPILSAMRSAVQAGRDVIDGLATFGIFALGGTAILSGISAWNTLWGNTGGNFGVSALIAAIALAGAILLHRWRKRRRWNLGKGMGEPKR